MGYAYYVLPDGREAGYGVDATCDREGCDVPIDRGLDYLCGDLPDGHRGDDEAGCGKYHCGDHQQEHNCPNPACGEWNAEETETCVRPVSHVADGLTHLGQDGDEWPVELAGDQR